MDGSWDQGQVCLSGHPINRFVRTEPAFNRHYCGDCGKGTTTTCQTCEVPIRGGWLGGGAVILRSWQPKPFCENCGHPFPWTADRLDALAVLAQDQDTLTEAERDQLSAGMESIVRNEPTSILAAERVKKLLIRIGPGAAEACRTVLIDVASEVVKKALLSP